MVSKKRLVERMQKKLPEVGQQFLGAMVETVFMSLAEELEVSERVKIPGFGTFRRKFRDARRIKSPLTGVVTVTQPKHVITFREEKPRRP